MSNPIVKIRVMQMTESCERTTYYVVLENSEGFTLESDSFATGSIYTNGEGLSIAEARDRALTMAHHWADFLGLTVEPYEEEGRFIEPMLKFETYTEQRNQR